MSEKTHEPSEQKLRQAREKGQIPRSKLFTSASVTLGGLLATVLFSAQTAAQLRTWATSALSGTVTSPAAALLESVRVLAVCLAPSLAGALLGSLASAVLTSGLQLNAGLLAPSFDRLNFVEGAKKLFSVRQLVEVGKGLLVAAVLAAIVWGAVRDSAPLAFRALTAEGANGYQALLEVWRPVVVRATVVLLVLGVVDLALARRKHRKDLMMTHEEVKQEHKNSEGDPHAKSQRKSMHKQLAAGGPARGVQKATAVVVNPTHIAVALRYDEGECEAPYLVAKAREEDALRMRAHAQNLGIPIIRDIPLARSLIHFDVGEQIPEELYQAAAAVLKVAMDEKEKAKP